MNLTVKDILKTFDGTKGNCISRTLSNIIDCIDDNDPLYNYKVALLARYGHVHTGGWRADDIHKQRDQFVVADEVCNTIASFLLDVDINSKSIVDYGCAEGSILWNIYKRYNPKQLVGIDCNLNSIKICNLLVKLNECKNIDFICGDYTKHNIFAHTAICIEPDPGPLPIGIDNHTVVYYGGEYDDVRAPVSGISFERYITERFIDRDVSVAGILPGHGQNKIHTCEELSHKNYYLMRVSKREV